MLDNLRRSLSAPMAVAALLAGWLLPYPAALIWTLSVIMAVMSPMLIPVLFTLKPSRPGVPVMAHVRTLATDFSFAVTQSLFVLVFLADQAWRMADAIVRTLYRLAVSRAHLLEWVPHAQTVAGAKRLSVANFTRRMPGAIVIGLTAALLAASQGGDVWKLAAPFALIWLFSPILALRASLPPTEAGRPYAALWRAFPAVARWASLSLVVAGQLPLTPGDARTLRLTARRTWRYFETFVTAADNMLPPDNFQEDPAPTVARRTSPTNIGLYLLSVVSAHDFGWIGREDALTRLEATLATMRKLEPLRGHFYNWYDTAALRPLEPKYISTVDSGNLAGHLIALARACAEWSKAPLNAAVGLQSVFDALDLARETAVRLFPPDAALRPDIANFLDLLARITASAATLPGEVNEPLPQLAQLAAQLAAQARTLAALAAADGLADLVYWTNAVHEVLRQRQPEAAQRDTESLDRLKAIEEGARELALAMEFGFLLDPKRKLLSIGYLVHEDALDPNCYDLVASEARLASFMAIAKGDVAARHWFRLGRAVTLVARRAALISWSGSMFEYLMPSLVMRAPGGSLLEQTSRLVVRRPIDYGNMLNVPWGISESAYNIRDLEFTYQYSNFGVPGLGLKRGLDANVVVAPHATALAAMVDPAAANFVRLAAVGGLGRYGFYEALDYTQVRVPEGASVAIVKAYMAHHQGMTIVAVANALLEARMRARFHA